MPANGSQYLVRALVVATLVASPACSDRELDAGDPVVLDESLRDQLYVRAEGWFEVGWLSRPAAAIEENAAFRMAPLLIHAISVESADEPPAPSLGALLRNPDGLLTVDTSRPTVYHSTSMVSTRGRELVQWSYVWWYATSAKDRRDSRAQGVRITLDGAGYPLVWEVLEDSTRARVLFVSDELEQTAIDTFGARNPGRMFTTERTLEEAPDVIVVRAIEAGATPLGPFIYLGRSGTDVMTLICRCMPSQVGEIPNTNEYALVPFESLSDLHVESPWDARPNDAHRLLRIPDGAF
jgi:hypothetical protein